jgi:hypothetical protein
VLKRCLVVVAVVLAGALAGCARVVTTLDSEVIFHRDQVKGQFFRPTQVIVLDGQEIIVDYGTSRLRFRRQGSGGEWTDSRVKLNHPHAVALGADGAYYVADTDNHRIVRLEHLDDPTGESVSSLAGQPLDKPHDIVLDPSTGLLYVIDATCRLYRFRAFGADEAVLQFAPEELGYARSVSVARGHVWVIGSAKGQVVRVDDFSTGRARVYAAPGKRKEAPSGTWSTTGLVLNDVEHFGGWWYGSNFFLGTPRADDDPNLYSLIRWRSWSDFEAGRWEDLSPLVERLGVPYYFAVDGKDRMYLACLRGSVYVLTPRDGGRVKADRLDGAPPR